MIDENIDPRMAIAQVIRELSMEGGDVDAFMAKINSAEGPEDAYNICMNTLMEVSR
jgi:hypothetical protein